MTGRLHTGRIVRAGLVAWIVTLAAASSAHAHGGLAAPSEVGPPLLTSGAIGVICYWLVMMWPSAKRPAEGGSTKSAAKPGGNSGGKAGNPALNNKRNGARRSRSNQAKARLKMVATTGARDRAESERNAADV